MTDLYECSYHSTSIPVKAECRLELLDWRRHTASPVSVLHLALFLLLLCFVSKPTMERPSRGRANTFTRAIENFLWRSLAAVEPRPVPETIGWRPTTLGRKSSGLSQHHVLGCIPAAKFEAAPKLKRQLSLSSSSSTDHGITPSYLPKVDIMEVTSRDTRSYSSSSSSRRVAFTSELLKPADSAKHANKLRQRAPSPYPGATQLPPIAKPKESIRREPLIRSRTRTLTMERLDGAHSLQQYLEEHPDALPPPGSTPAFVDQYWPLRRPSVDSQLSDPEADDEASDVTDTEYRSCSTYAEPDDSDDSDDPGRWECETAYESCDEDEQGLALPPPRRQYTPAATRPPLLRHAQTLSPPETPQDDDSPAPQAAKNPPGRVKLGSPPQTPPTNIPQLPPSPPTTPNDASSWLPTDPSALPNLHYPGFDLPHLLWKRITVDGQHFLSTVRPPSGFTAGKAPRGAGGPTHTPNRGYFHLADPRMDAVDAAELARQLERVVSRDRDGEEEKEEDGRDYWGLRRSGAAVAAGVAAGYDAEQERIRRRYESWEGGVRKQGQGEAEWWGAEADIRWNGSRTGAEFKLKTQVDDGRRQRPAQASPPLGEYEGEKENELEVRIVEEAKEDFPLYQQAEDRFLQELLEEEDAVLLPDYAAAGPGGKEDRRAGVARWPKTGCLPKSRAHRKRAASRGVGGVGVEKQYQPQCEKQCHLRMDETVVMAQVTALAMVL